MNTRVSDDEGLGMVELVAYLALSVLVLTVLISVFVSASRTQAATKNRDVAAGTSQVATNSIQAGIRNASSFNITGNLLRARVASGNSASWLCHAWALTPTRQLVYKTSSSAIAVPSDFTGWTPLASGVAGNLTAGAVFLADGASGARLRYGFTVTAGSGGQAASVSVTGAAVALSKGTGSPSTCW